MSYGDFDRDGADRDNDARHGEHVDEPTSRSATGRVPVGDQLRPGGAFSVGAGAGPVKPASGAGRASVGRVTVGRATVPASDEATGRASVPGPGAASGLRGASPAANGG